ncbi:MAG: DUF4325 domain-containing protein [Planctomycetia bacterium]|nr:DUF4325 domain-containing protein [Planctomycetia bacterium]
MKIKVSEIDTICIKEETGVALYNKILPYIKKGESVELDFEGVEMLTPYFIRVALAPLILNGFIEQLDEKITFTNTDKFDKELIDYVVECECTKKEEIPMYHSMNLVVKDLYSIKEANIALNGITVVTGENGCGKSILSQLLYHTFRMPDTVAQLLCVKCLRKLSPVVELMEYCRDNYEDVIGWHYREMTTLWEIKKYLEEWLDYMQSDEIRKNKAFRKQLKVAWKQLFEGVGCPKSAYKKLSALKNCVDHWYHTYTDELSRKRTQYLYEYLKDVLSIDVEGKFDIIEDNTVHLIDNEDKCIPTSSIRDALYLNNPGVLYKYIELPYEKVPNWDHAYSVALQSVYSEGYDRNKPLILKMRNTVGDTLENEGVLHFQRHGSPVVSRLDESSNGEKLMGTIYQLIRKEYFREDVLTILDEPEMNLHPVWIVEYARMIVLLHKHCGTRFFISSHNPDMISALQKIAKKEGVVIDFYLAEPVSKSGQYVYQHQGNSVEKIFASFNEALKRIEEYGEE